jgi:hypothetical protein
VKLTRRGFLSAAAVLPLVPILLRDAVKVTVSARPGGLSFVHPDQYEMLMKFCDQAVFHKSRSIGPTVGVLEGAGQHVHRLYNWPAPNVAELAFADSPNVPAKWVDRSAPTRGDIEQLLAELRRPMPRPDLVIIDGIGYGKGDPLPEVEPIPARPPELWPMPPPPLPCDTKVTW